MKEDEEKKAKRKEKKRKAAVAEGSEASRHLALSSEYSEGTATQTP